MSYSKKKMGVVATRKLPKNYGGKRWVVVEMKRSQRWIPSFEDLHRIIQAIALCEDEKYPTGKGRKMVAEFLDAAVTEPDYDKLRVRFSIPDRCSSIPAGREPQS